MKRFELIAALMLLFIFAGYSSCFAQGVVGKIQGIVTIDGAPAKAADPVKDGSIIEADKNAYVDIRFDDSDVIRVKNGRVVFSLASNKTHLSVVRGSVYISIRKFFASNRTFSLDSRNAVAGVRGTKFLFEAAPEGTYVCVCEGVVTVSPKVDERIQKNVAKDYDLWIKDGKPVKEPKLSPDMSLMTNQVFEDMGIPAK